MSLIPEMFLNAVVAIGFVVDEDSFVYMGSGFIVEKSIAKDKYLNFIVTNKHVFEGKETAIIRVRDVEGKPVDVSIPLGCVSKFGLST